MVTEPLTIGVIGIQGAVSEHVTMMKQVFSDLSLYGTVRVIKPSDSISDCDGVILPGGESTTISRVLTSSGLFSELQKRAFEKSLVIMGTCAGCILLSSDLVNTTKDVNVLGLMDMQVQRNAYGRQKESFEQNINISSISSDDTDLLFPAVFIRAPVIKKVWGESIEVLSFDAAQKPVMVRQDNCVALTFHPELSNDTRIHQYFLSLVQTYKKKM